MGEHYYNTRGMLPRISANAQLFLCVLACGIFIASGDETIAALNKIYTEASADHTAFYRTYHAALLAQKGFEKSLAAEEQMVAPMEAEIAAPQVAAQQVMAPQGEAPQVMSAQMAVPASMMQRSHMPHSDPMDGGANRYWQSSKAVPHQPKKQPTAKQWKDLNYLGENPRDTQGQHSSLAATKAKHFHVRDWRDSHTYPSDSSLPEPTSASKTEERQKEKQDDGSDGAVEGHPLLRAGGITGSRDSKADHSKKSMALVQELQEAGLHAGFVEQLVSRTAKNRAKPGAKNADKLVQKINDQILKEAAKAH